MTSLESYGAAQFSTTRTFDGSLVGTRSNAPLDA
jgi:hypothetical protein